MKLNDVIIRCFVYIALFSLVYVSVSGGSIQKSDNEEHEDEIKRQVPKVFDYGKYVEKFKKSYGPLETLRKAKLFFARTLKIFQHNVLYTQKRVAYFLTQNFFTDMLASELKQMHMNKERELAPVKEALINPDLPADRLASVLRLKVDRDEGFSQASADDLAKNAKYVAERRQVKPVLNFMENDDVVDMKVVLREIREKPDVAAKVAKMIELKVDEAQIFEESWRRREALGTTNPNQVEYKPVVESNNKNYEPQVAISYAAPQMDGQNYAIHLMDGFNLAPYPEAEEVEDEESEEKSPFFSRFFDTVRGMTDYLIGSNDEEHEEKEEEEEKHEEMKEKLHLTKASGSPVTEYIIDWRQTGCIAPVQNQKSCDSCYAFTVLGLMEYFHCRQTHQLTSFSAQYIVDCGAKTNLNGCRGSMISNVGQFIKNYGIELNAKYPYNGQENTCPYNFDDQTEADKSGYLRPTISHWQNFQDMAAWYKWLRKSPIIVGINMPADFLAYGGGVHDGLDCIENMTHAMLLVGSGIQDGQEFWLLKNSYSEFWGEEGYFRLSKSAPLGCFNSAIVARAKFTTSAPRPTVSQN